MDPQYSESEDGEIFSKEEAEMEEAEMGDMKEDLDRLQQEDIVKDALTNGVDLSVYGSQIDADLAKYCQVSIQDYIKESKESAHLHLEMEACNAILNDMEGILSKYQKDLEKAMGEIQNLQEEADRITIRLKNRHDVDMEIRGIVNELTLSHSMVNYLLTGDIDDTYFEHLQQFSRSLDFVDCVNVNDAVMIKRSMVRAVEEVKVDLNILRLHCGNRIRDALYRKFGEIRKDSNIQMFEKEVLLRLQPGVRFLQKHLPAYYEEIRRRYVAVMQPIVFSIFTDYLKQLTSRCYAIGTSEDSILGTSHAKPFLKKTVRGNREWLENIYTLFNRHTVVDFMDAAPLLPSILIMEGQFLTYPECYRSIQRHLIDCALAEFEFEVLFFGLDDTQLFIDVYESACGAIHDNTVAWLRGSFDVLGLLLLCILLQAGIEELAKDGIPIFVEFFINLRTKAMARFRELMNTELTIVRSVPLRPKDLKITEEIHPCIKQYAALSCSIYILGYSYDMFINHELWEEYMNNLASEMVNLLVKIVNGLKENKRPLHILNSCLYVVDVYDAKHISVENDFTHLYRDRIHLYVEENMARYFSTLVTIVDKYSAQNTRQPSFSSVEIKAIQKYAGTWKESLHAVTERVKEDIQYRRTDVLKMITTEMTNYHAKYVQLLQGTICAKDVVPLQTVMAEVNTIRTSFVKVESPIHASGYMS